MERAKHSRRRHRATNEIQRATIALRDKLGEIESADLDPRASARRMLDDVIPLMAAVRSAGDELEQLVDDDIWPLPKYRELMFIR